MARRKGDKDKTRLYPRLRTMIYLGVPAFLGLWGLACLHQQLSVFPVAHGVASVPPALQKSSSRSERVCALDVARNASPQLHVEQRPTLCKRAGAKGQLVHIVVVVPFRDRESHLVKFKEYWRWFASMSLNVHSWSIYIVEQFDSATFNRGWAFNVGFAVATRYARSSIDIPALPPMENATCIVIQDIDLLPEKGVDYSSCQRPTQLCSEIDRYHWSVPYPQSSGGTVAMQPEHWLKLNGFPNGYFGWGGEDDELFHRLRLNKLLANTGYINRPAKGHGRFSGHHMNSANHTKRMDNPKDYDENIKMLQEIEKVSESKSSDRWNFDGLRNLSFRIVNYSIDYEDCEETGITYHFVKVRRGSASHDLSRISLAIPVVELCTLGVNADPWMYTDLGTPVPWDVHALRRRVEESLPCPTNNLVKEKVRRLSFVLVDSETTLAKVFGEGDSRLLRVFYRSLSAPQKTGVVIADIRDQAGLEKTALAHGRLWSPPTTFCVCSKEERGAQRYNLFVGQACKPGKWQLVSGSVFRAFTKPVAGHDFLQVCYAENEQQQMYRIAQGSKCDAVWNGLQWKDQRELYVDGSSHEFCVGTRDVAAAQGPGSRILPLATCAGDGFRHDFVFGSPALDPVKPPTILLCVNLRNDQAARVDVAPSGCVPNASLLQLPVVVGASFDNSHTHCLCRSRKVCTVMPGDVHGIVISEFTDETAEGCKSRCESTLACACYAFDPSRANTCWLKGSPCGDANEWSESGDMTTGVCQASDAHSGDFFCRGSSCCPKATIQHLCFSVVYANSTQAKSCRKPLCVGKRRDTTSDRSDVILRAKEDCHDHEYDHDFLLWVPSKADIVETSYDEKMHGLFTLLREDEECRGFACADTLGLLSEVS